MNTISILDKDYAQWLKELRGRYRSSQIKAAVKVNQEMLQFYWELGRDIVERDVENKYGDGFYTRLSRDLKEAIPEMNGLSDRTIRYTKKFYLLYIEMYRNLQQVVAKSHGRQVEGNLQQLVAFSQAKIDEKMPQLAAQLLSDIFSIPWGHHVRIIDKCFDNPSKALFYVHQTVENGWSRNVLLNFLGTDLYERQGKAQTNFKHTLPDETSDLAQELTKDPYNFAFTGITGQPVGISEYELEKFYPEKVEGTIPSIEELEVKLSERLPVQ